MLSVVDMMMVQDILLRLLPCTTSHCLSMILPMNNYDIFAEI